MSYELQFKKKALKEWNKLNPTVQAEFLNILERRLQNPSLAGVPTNEDAKSSTSEEHRKANRHL